MDVVQFSSLRPLTLVPLFTKCYASFHFQRVTRRHNMYGLFYEGLVQRKISDELQFAKRCTYCVTDKLLIEEEGKVNIKDLNFLCHQLFNIVFSIKPLLIQCHINLVIKQLHLCWCCKLFHIIFIVCDHSPPTCYNPFWHVSSGGYGRYIYGGTLLGSELGSDEGFTLGSKLVVEIRISN